MDDIKSSIIKTALTGSGVLALAVLTIVFGGMSRQALLFVILFVLVAVLAVFVGCLMWRVNALEELADKLLKETN